MKSRDDKGPRRVTGRAFMEQANANASICAGFGVLAEAACTCGRDRGLCATCRAWFGLRARLQRRTGLAQTAPLDCLEDRA